ncbi:hypothetical protein CDL15_Pgr025232 [Punica granatum]|uniref:Uncharacterized protein n=1 Tax=Punica granatum TaxID=22663 RepID=A0A218W8C5_PUNGR|nr:hypothetical protein CDL15_Pgr025232 [Punica granatum]
MVYCETKLRQFAAAGLWKAKKVGLNWRGTSCCYRRSYGKRAKLNAEKQELPSRSETHRTRSRHDELGIEVEEFEMATTGGVDGGVGKTMKR